MKLLTLLTSLFLASFTCTAQSAVGDSLRRIGQLDNAIDAYKKSLSDNPDDTETAYSLACALALTYQQNDDAFKYLFKSLAQDSSLWALADNDLLGLTEDDQWADIITGQLRKYQSKHGPLEDPAYAVQLLALIMKDQAMDYPIDQAKNHFMQNGSVPHWYYPIADMKRRIGEENFIEMQALIEEYGWPKYSTVGPLAADAPLLVINHHENDDVRIQYLDIIKEHCLSGEGSCMEYAKIQDRVLVNEGKPQIYGMQFRYAADRSLEPFPIRDPEYVDQRRTEIGLEPLKDYLERKIGYQWTIPQQ